MVATSTVEPNGIKARLARFAPYELIPQHEHSGLSFTMLVSGLIHAKWPGRSFTRELLSVSCDPFDQLPPPDIGPEGMTMLVLEFSEQAADLMGFSRTTIGDAKMLVGAGAAEAGLQIAANIGSPNWTDHALELASQFCEKPEQNRPKWLTQARQMIETRYFQAIGLSDIARGVGIDPTHLARTYRQAYGTSVGAAIEEVRIYEAAKLVFSGSTLCDAASQVGFVDTSHFRRRLITRLGLTPADLRSLGS